MGRPPGPHSARAPAGSTAVPGLIPDLVARIPWLRWALIATAVVAGVLVVSCLLCAICRRGRHRKKPRDEEAVGLGSACSTIDTHLVQPDVDDVEPGPGGPQQRERLQLSVEYDFGSQAIKVGLKQAARWTPTPASASPLRPGAGTRRRCTVVPSAPRSRRPALSTALREGPACAEPEEVEEEKDICQEEHGHPLLQRGLHLPCAFQPDPGGLPGGGGGWNLAQGQTDGCLSPPPTAPRPASTQSVALVLAVWARGPQFRAEPVSKVLLGARASGQPLQHWADMLAHARRPIAQWHRLQPARDVDRALALQPHLRLPLPGS
eukprot:bmy_05017T0